MEVNLSLVFECLRHHEPGNLAAQKDSLLTIASLCSENDEAKNIFRESGGLGYVLNMLTTVTDDDVRGTVLYTLGCATERNVYSQRRLCSDALFKFLLCQITSVRASIKLKRSAAFLLTCLVTNNSAGQNLIRSSGCVDGLLKSLKSLSSSASEDLQKALCFDIIKTLCSCVNNPRHEENQILCAAVFPVVLKLLKEQSDVEVTKLLASFISLTVANSEMNQERLGLLGGINLMTSCLQNLLQTLVKQPNHQLVNAISGLVTALGISSCDHEMNIQTLTELKVIPLLVQVLSLEVVSVEVKLKVILTISVITRSSEISQKQLVDCDGMVLLVHMLMENQNNEEMTKAITSVLQSCVGWVSTLGIENMLYAKTLSAVHVSHPQETDKLNTGQVCEEKSEILQHPLTPVQLEKTIPNDSRCITCHKEIESYTGSLVHSVTSDDLGKLQTQVGHLEEKFNLVLRYLDTPQHQQSIGLDGETKRKFEKQKNLEEMMNVIREKSDRKCEVYQKRSRDGDTVKGVDKKPGELFDKAREEEKKENKRNIGKVRVSSSMNCGNEFEDFLYFKNTDGVISQKGLKDLSSGWRYPLPYKQVSQDEHPGIERHCYKGEGGGHGYNFGRNRMVSRNGPVTGCDPKENSDLEFSSGGKQSRGDYSQAYARHINFKCIEQNGRKSVTVTDAEQFTKSEDKIRGDLSLGCKQTDGCQSDVTPLDINRDTRAVKETTGNLKESSGLRSNGNTRKSGGRKDRGENYNHTTLYSRDKIDDVGKRRRRHQSAEWNQHLSLDVSSDGFRKPGCTKDQLLSNKTFVKAAVEATRHICSGHNDRGLVIAVKEGNNLAIHKLAPRRSTSIRQCRKSISTFSESDNIRDLLSDLPLNSSYGTKRRKRQNFSSDEVHHLIKEVKRQGKHWNSILWSGNYKKGRTAVDLKDKYRRLVANNVHGKISAEAK